MAPFQHLNRYIFQCDNIDSVNAKESEGVAKARGEAAFSICKDSLHGFLPVDIVYHFVLAFDLPSSFTHFILASTIRGCNYNIVNTKINNN